MKITEIVRVKPNIYQGKSSVSFKFAGDDRTLSCLTDNVSLFAVGAEIEGSITAKEKDGKTFYNFYPKRTESRPASKGMTEDQYTKLVQLLNTINTNVLRLLPGKESYKPDVSKMDFTAKKEYEDDVAQVFNSPPF